MRDPNDIAEDLAAMDTMQDLTGAFQGLASMRISQIKNRVIISQRFFDELWRIYDQIRVDELFRFGRDKGEDVINKELIIAVTAEGGFSGDIDKHLVDSIQKVYNKDKQDVIVIGHHGAIQLARSSIPFQRYFKMPSSDININVKPLAAEVKKYRTTTVFYQSYVSLMNQEVKQIELHEAVTSAGHNVAASDEVIDEKTYIFEPNSFAVMSHLERSMMEATLSQKIFESKLAQYASRFRAMSAAHDKSNEEYNGLKMELNHAKRAKSDERLKEIINGMKTVKV